MTTIQAYRRTKVTTQAAAGLSLIFKPNAQGDVVCDVEDQSAIDFLLGESASYRVYGVEAEQPMSPLLTAPAPVEELPPAAPAEPPAPVEELPLAPVVPDSPYVLKDGENTFDLRPLSDDELHAFAKANGITISAKAKGDTIRDRIVAFLSEPSVGADKA